MINVSEQLKEESKKNHNYYVTANVTLADGTKLSLEKKDFYLDGNGIIDAADSSDFPIGVAIEKTATLSLVNDKGQFDAYSFNGAVFTIFIICSYRIVWKPLKEVVLSYAGNRQLTVRLT